MAFSGARLSVVQSKRWRGPTWRPEERIPIGILHKDALGGAHLLPKRSRRNGLKIHLGCTPGRVGAPLLRPQVSTVLPSITYPSGSAMFGKTAKTSGTLCILNG